MERKSLHWRYHWQYKSFSELKGRKIKWKDMTVIEMQSIYATKEMNTKRQVVFHLRHKRIVTSSQRDIYRTNWSQMPNESIPLGCGGDQDLSSDQSSLFPLWIRMSLKYENCLFVSSVYKKKNIFHIFVERHEKRDFSWFVWEFHTLSHIDKTLLLMKSKEFIWKCMTCCVRRGRMALICWRWFANTLPITHTSHRIYEILV